MQVQKNVTKNNQSNSSKQLTTSESVYLIIRASWNAHNRQKVESSKYKHNSYSR